MATVLEKMPNYSNNVVDKTENLNLCPRYMNDVYSLGTNLQYYLGDIYMHLAKSTQGELKDQYEKMAFEELIIKDEIQKVSNARLNEMLGDFYNSGGAVVELPLSHKLSKETQPFFNRILDNFTKQVESSTVLAANGTISAGKLENMVKYDIIEMYTNMSKLFPEEEIVKAFNKLITIREMI